MSTDSLWLALEATFSADRPTRQQAEEFLTRGGDFGFASRGEWCALLLEFATTPVCEGAPPRAQSLATDLDVRVASAVFLKNSVSEKEWLGGESFPPHVKAPFRERLITALCDIGLADRVRKVLVSLLEHIHSYDWLRGEWPELLSITLNALRSSLDGFDALAAAFVSTVHDNAGDFGFAPEAAADADLSSHLKVMATCAQLLKLCSKAYDDPLKVTIKDQDANADQVCGPLGEILSRLSSSEWLDAVRYAAKTVALLDPTKPLPPNSATWVHVAAACDEAAYMAVKAAWYIAGNRIPVAFADETYFTAFQSALVAFWSHCNDCFYDFRNGSLLSRRGEPLDADEVLASTDRAKSLYFWKLYKRVASLAHRFLQVTIRTKHVEVRLKPLAKAFVEQFAPTMLTYAFTTISLHNNKSSLGDVLGSDDFNARYPPACTADAIATPEQPVTSKAFIMSLEFVEVATGNEALYGAIRPVASPLLTEILFDRLAITAAERELWGSNPVDYVRRLLDPRGDLWSSKLCSASLLRQLCIPAKTFQDTSLIVEFATYIQNVLVGAPQQLAGATDFEEGSTAWFAALKLDACLYAMNHLRDAVSNAWPIATVMHDFVMPLLSSNVGFLRANAVHVLASFLPKIEWPSEAAYHELLDLILPLLRDADGPVRIRTAMACSGFIRHPLAYNAVAPHLGSVIKDLLDVVKEMDSESVVHAMRKIVKHYAATVSEWAVQLASALVDHFKSLHQTIAMKLEAYDESTAGAIARKAEDEDDGQDEVEDAIAAADELLATLATMTKAIPRTPDAAQVFYQLQEIIAPVLSVLLSGTSNTSFMDIALRLLTRLVKRCDTVLPVTWEVFRALHNVICEGNAVDYFGRLISPIDNFLSVDPTTFVEASANAPEGDSSQSPAALLLEMCHAVLKQTAMLRRREVLPIFAVTDIVFVNVQNAKTSPETNAVFARRFCGAFAALPAQYYADLQQRGRAEPQPAEWAIMSTAYLSVVLYAAKTLAADELLAIFPPEQLFYVTSSLGDMAPKFVRLRVYDRKVYVAAVLALIASLSNSPDAVDVQQVSSALRSAVLMALQNAAVDAAAVRRAVKLAAKYDGKKGSAPKHVDPNAMEDFTSDDDDDDDSDDGSSADEADGSEDDDDVEGIDTDDQFEDDLGDEGSERDEDDKAIRNYDHFATTVAAARKMAAKEAGLIDDDEDEDELNEDHLDETDFTSPIDTYDEFSALQELLANAEHTGGWLAHVVQNSTSDFMTVSNVLPETCVPEGAEQSLCKHGPPTLVHSADCNSGDSFGGDYAGPDVSVPLRDLLVAASKQRHFLSEHHITSKR